MKYFLVLIPLLYVFSINAQTKGSIYQKDFEQYWQTINESFAYFDTQGTDWEKVKEIYQPMIDTISHTRNFISLLEQCNLEFYNGHIGLNTNLPSSSRLIPSGTDLWVIKKRNKYYIESIRERSRISKTELQSGIEILQFNGVALEEALKPFLPLYTKIHSTEMYEHAVNILLAGKHNGTREITVLLDGRSKKVKLPHTEDQEYYENPLIEAKSLEANIGYIKINNSLYNQDLINLFDKTLDSLSNTKGLILDLRETPSGGNNTVAKAIMGRFIENEKPYQRYRYVYDERSSDVEQIWTELVIPRKDIYKNPLIVLVGRWTGSMGEGITIGLDGMQRAEIIGTPMARLLGAVWNYTLEETKIGFQIPGIKLYHVNKTPREDFVPKTIPNDPSNSLNLALEWIKKQ